MNSSVNYLVQMTNDSNFKSISKVKTLLHQIIYWEPLRKQKLFQCYRCQRVGHASANCVLQPRCVKCALNHGKGQCTLTEKTNDNVKCANCEEAHPASYRGCAYLKFAEAKHREF